MHELNKHLWDAGNEIKKSFEMKLEKIKKRLFCSVKVTVLCNGVIRKRLNFAVQSSISWDEWRAGFANPSGLSRVIADSLPSP